MNSNFATNETIMLVVLFAMVSQLFRVFALQLLLRPYVVLDLQTGLFSNLISFSSNSILPFRLGELFKSLYLARKFNASLSITLPAVFLEKLIDLLCFTLLVIALAFRNDLALDTILLSASQPLVLLAALTILLLFFANIHPIYPGKFWSLRLAVFSVNKYIKQLNARQLTLVTLFILLSWIFFSLSIFILSNVFNEAVESWIIHNLSIFGFIWNLIETNNAGFVILVLIFVSIVFPYFFVTLSKLLFSMVRKSELPFYMESPVGSILADRWPRWAKIGYSKDQTKEFRLVVNKLGYEFVTNLNGGSGAIVALTKANSSGVFKVIKISQRLGSNRLLEQGLFMIKNIDSYYFPETKILQATKKQVVLEVEYLENQRTISEYYERRPGIADSTNLDSKIYTFLERAHGPRKKLSRELSESLVENFLSNKILTTIEQCTRFAPELPTASSIKINGTEYLGINELTDFLKKNTNLFRPKYVVNSVHGDSTFSNLFVNELHHSIEIRSIDPNPSQPYNSPAIDFAKVLQSSLGNYEFLFESATLIALTENNIEFTEEINEDNSRITLHFLDQMNNDMEFRREVLFQLFCHFVRLIPYRISNDRLRAPIFWARMIQVGNYLKDEIESA